MAYELSLINHISKIKLPQKGLDFARNINFVKLPTIQHQTALHQSLKLLILLPQLL